MCAIDDKCVEPSSCQTTKVCNAFLGVHSACFRNLYQPALSCPQVSDLIKGKHNDASPDVP